VQFAGTKSASSLDAASTYAVNCNIQAAQTRGALHEFQISMSSLLSRPYVMQLYKPVLR